MRTTNTELIVESLKMRPAMTSQELANSLGMTESGASGALSSLFAQNRVERIRKGRQYIYSASKGPRTPKRKLSNRVQRSDAGRPRDTPPGYKTPEHVVAPPTPVQGELPMIVGARVPAPDASPMSNHDFLDFLDKYLDGKLPAKPVQMVPNPSPVNGVSVAIIIDGARIDVSVSEAKSVWMQLNSIFA